MTDSSQVSSAYFRAEGYIRHRPRSIEETRRKLNSLGFDCDVVEETIARLEGEGQLNDLVFGRLLMEEMLRKQYGFRRIRAALGQKLVESVVMEQLLEDYPFDTEYERAVATARAYSRKRTGTGPDDRNHLSRLYAYLQRRGFSMELSRKTARGIGSVDT